MSPIFLLAFLNSLALFHGISLAATDAAGKSSPSPDISKHAAHLRFFLGGGLGNLLPQESLLPCREITLDKLLDFVL